MFSFFLSRKQCINFLVTSATLKKKKNWELNQPKPNLNWTYAIQLGSILWPDNTTYHVVLLVFPIIIIPCRVHEQKVNIAFCTSFPLGTIWAPLYTHTHTPEVSIHRITMNYLLGWVCSLWTIGHPY